MTIHTFLLSTLMIFITTSNLLIAQEDEFEELDSELFATDTTIDSAPVRDIFNSTRIINGHSTETLGKKVMEFRVEHRFGDIAGAAGGVQQMFGFDNIADIRLALEYGITDNLMIGFGRSKGSGAPYRSLVDLFMKYRFIDQRKGGSPVSVSALGLMTFTYMKASTDSTQITFFPKFIHRLSYASQLNISRKFHDRLSLALIPTVVHQNYVDGNNQNTLFSLGGGARIGVTGTFGILLEYYHCFSSNAIRQDFTNSLSVAAEFITFGHNFTLFFSNARGLGETQFITNTTSDWLKGQFRFGFAVGRKFEY